MVTATCLCGIEHRIPAKADEYPCRFCGLNTYTKAAGKFVPNSTLAAVSPPAATEPTPVVELAAEIVAHAPQIAEALEEETPAAQATAD